MFLFEGAPSHQYLVHVPVASHALGFSETTLRRVGKTEDNETNSSVTKRRKLEGEKAYYFLKPFLNLNAIL